MMKKYKLPLLLTVLFLVAVSNYFRMSENYEVRSVQAVQLIGIGFLAGVIMMLFIMIFKEGRS